MISELYSFQDTPIQQESYNKKVYARRERTAKGECWVLPPCTMNLMHDVRRQGICNTEELIYLLDPWAGETTPLSAWYASVNGPIWMPRQPWRSQACGKVG
jgi:hypothetical protein